MAGRTGGLWFTRCEAAALCGIGDRQFDKVIRPRLTPKDHQGAAQKLRLNGPALVAALVAYRIEQAAPVVGESDPLLTGAESPALERYRLARAKMAERDLAERDQELVRAGMIRDAFLPAVRNMRGAGDRLARRFGNDAADIFNEGVAEFEAAALRAIEAGETKPEKSDEHRRG